MAHTVKRITRGPSTKVNSYAGPAGELVMDTTTNDLVLETGTAGGVRMAKASTAIAASNGITISAGGTLGQATTISGVNATVSARGVVQLNNATNSTAQNQAATPKAVSDALQAAKDYADTAAGGATPNVSNATGTLPVIHGGTGLTSSPSMLTNLGSTTADNVLKASPRPGITGTLPIANGGTGSTTKNFVDLTSAQTVAGEKTLTANPIIKTTSPSITLQQTDIKKGTNPSANQSVSVIMVDSAGTANANRTGYLSNAVSTAGLTSTVLYAYQFASGSTANAALGVYCSADGNTKYATAPTPAAGDSSTKIATTAWVAANAPSFSGTVTQKATRTTTGNWSITGLTVGKPLYILADLANSQHSGARLYLVSGGVGGKFNSTSYDSFVLGRYADPGPDVFVTIPTNSTVVLNVWWIEGSPTMYAYQ